MTPTATETETALARIVEHVRSHHRFVVTSHARPDGDAVGSSMAMAYALRHLGKDVRVVSCDPPPPPLAPFPGVGDIAVTSRVDDPGDGVIVMECGTLARTGIDGLERGCLINIDHHVGNSMYGAINWFDVSAAACGEMVFDLVHALGVPLTMEIAAHVYVAILTDTGSFHYSNITPRTFDICRQCLAAGVDPTVVARTIYDSRTLPQLRVHGALLDRMRLDATGRIATLSIDRAFAAGLGATYDDTEGLINQPLTVKEILAVAFFKEQGPGDWRVSMRSKGDVDINAIAKEFGGGGHKNASGCSAQGTIEQLTNIFEKKIADAIARADAGTRDGDPTNHRVTETRSRS